MKTIIKLDFYMIEIEILSQRELLELVIKASFFPYNSTL